jgi:hypothetical protein
VIFYSVGMTPASVGLAGAPTHSVDAERGMIFSETSSRFQTFLWLEQIRAEAIAASLAS